MDVVTSLLAFGVCAALYIAWNVGTSDVPNLLATHVSTRSLPLRDSLFVAMLGELSGALLLGDHVAIRIASLWTGAMSPLAAATSAAAALGASAVWLWVTSLRSVPVSASQSIVSTSVGALLAVGVTVNSVTHALWPTALSWLLVPLLAAGMSYLVFRGGRSVAQGSGVSRPLQLATLFALCVGHGAVAAGATAGPLLALFAAMTGQGLALTSTLRVLGLAAFGILLGAATGGVPVLRQLRRELTELAPSRAVPVEFAGATLLLLASSFGLVVSSGQTLVGAVLGGGMSRGMTAIDLRVLRQVALGIVFTVVVCSGFAFALTRLLT